MSAHRTGLVLLLACLFAPIAACKGRTPAPPAATTASPTDAPATERVVGPLSPEEAATLKVMNDKIFEYVVLHRRLEGALEKVPVDATPEQIDTFQRALEREVRAARMSAKEGDIFTPEARVVIRRLLATIFGGPDGKELKESVLDETPVGVKLAVNGRYPDNVPMSTIPPQVLQTLPKLAEEMEYRFVGDALVLLDVHAHVIADFIPDALPK